MTVRDYAAIKLEYVQGIDVDGKRVIPTFDDLAKAHGVNASNLRKRAAKERWAAARRKFAAKVQQETENARAKVIGSKAAQLDAKSALIASRALELIEVELVKIKPVKKRGQTVATIDRERLKSLLDSAKKAQDIGRVALGQPLDPGAAPPDPNAAPMPDLTDATDEQLRELAAGLARLQSNRG